MWVRGERLLDDQVDLGSWDVDFDGLFLAVHGEVIRVVAMDGDDGLFSFAGLELSLVDALHVVDYSGRISNLLDAIRFTLSAAPEGGTAECQYEASVDQGATLQACSGPSRARKETFDLTTLLAKSQLFCGFVDGCR